MCKAGMKRRSQKLEVVLDIQKVTCPWVMLPTKGAIYLSLCLFGEYIRTKETAPVFPLKFFQKFKVQKTFGHVFRLSDLDELLDAEVVYMELIQRYIDRPDTVLATFETSARELLFPNVVSTSQQSGADLDLLMEPTVHFSERCPPRLEMSTETAIHEVRTNISPRVPSRTGPSGKTTVPLPKTTRGRAPGERPPWRWCRPGPTLIGRAPGDVAAPPGRRYRRRSPRTASAGGRHCHCSCLQPAGSGGGGGGRTESADRLERAPSAGRRQRARGAARSRSLEQTKAEPEEEGRRKGQGGCGHCKRTHPNHACSVCSAYQQYFHRNYAGHYHEDCRQSCRCPVTADGVRHVHGLTSQGDSPDLGSHLPDSEGLAREWRAFVSTHSSEDTDRQAFYRKLEQFYRKIYTDATRQAMVDVV